MRRRRKQNRKTIQNGPGFPVSLALILALVAGLSFGYLWLRDQCDVLGRRLQGLEARRDEVQRRILSEESRWSQLISPPRLRQLMEQFRIVMVYPGETYTRRVGRPELEPVSSSERLYAQRETTTRHD